ncbi:unnamed protein product [Spirodela intermedia]|uniref:Uncharacterized protein n=1 Tax=Spirodela intermedia TaxID=51605 RepID=A0A7I8KZ00_SPIIN|nr:unnamed protein product [Spirodela intermedia]
MPPQLPPDVDQDKQEGPWKLLSRLHFGQAPSRTGADGEKLPSAEACTGDAAVRRARRVLAAAVAGDRISQKKVAGEDQEDHDEYIHEQAEEVRQAVPAVARGYQMGRKNAAEEGQEEKCCGDYAQELRQTAPAVVQDRTGGGEEEKVATEGQEEEEKGKWGCSVELRGAAQEGLGVEGQEDPEEGGEAAKVHQGVLVVVRGDPMGVAVVGQEDPEEEGEAANVHRGTLEDSEKGEEGSSAEDVLQAAPAVAGVVAGSCWRRMDVSTSSGVWFGGMLSRRSRRFMKD